MAASARRSTSTTGRTVYLSNIVGASALDCDLRTGAKVGGGTPTDNLAAINAVLAQATATSPVLLVVDGGCAIGGPLAAPAGGRVTLAGQGWDTGFFVMNGATSNGFQNVADTDVAVDNAWQPSTRPQSIVGSGVTIRNLKIHCNRGTYPSGNCNGTKDNTMTTGTYSPDARGNYPDRFFYCGILLVGADKVVIDGCWIYDAPTFHVSLYHCSRVWFTNNLIESGNPAVAGNTDGLHVNGGCKTLVVTGNVFRNGDDAIAINVEEGDGSAGQDFVIADNVFEDCHACVRVYGQTIRTKRVRIANNTAFNVWDRFLNVGNESSGSNSTRDVNASITVDGLDFHSNGARAMAWVNGNVGCLALKGINVHEATSACPVVLMQHSAIVSAMDVDVHIHRNHNGSAAFPVLQGDAGCRIGSLNATVRVTEEEGQAYTDIAKLFDLANLVVGRVSLEADVSGVATVLDVPASATCGPVALRDTYHKSNAGTNAARTVVSGTSSPLPVSVGRYSSTNVGGVSSGNVTLS